MAEVTKEAMQQEALRRMKLLKLHQNPIKEFWTEGKLNLTEPNGALFYIAVEDNEWSVAVELIQKEPPWGCYIEGFQKQHYEKYLDGMKRCLLNCLPSIGTYAGAWTSGKIIR